MSDVSRLPRQPGDSTASDRKIPPFHPANLLAKPLPTLSARIRYALKHLEHSKTYIASQVAESLSGWSNSCRNIRRIGKLLVLHGYFFLDGRHGETSAERWCR